MKQLGFDTLLAEAAVDNAARAFAKETAHLPDTWNAAVAYHQQQIEEHHAKMLACDFEGAQVIRREARLLARKLNKGAPGILAGPDAPGCRLAKACTAPEGCEPQWGQDGLFTLEASDLQMLVEVGGMFGIGATAMPYIGFSVRAVDTARKFLSSTGFRSFLGASVPPEEGTTVADFVLRVVMHHIETELGGSLVTLSEKPE